MTRRVTVVAPGELGTAEAVRWEQLREGSPALLSPFLSFTFAQVVGRARRSARVAVVEEDGEIAAFLPFEVTAARVGMPIGWPMNDLQGFIGSDRRLDARAIVRKAGLRGWRFMHAPVEQSALAAHRYAGTEIDCSVIDLADGHDAYLAAAGLVSGRAARKRRAQRRALERELGELTFDWNSPDPEHLQLMMRWKAGKYHASRELFRDPSAVHILQELSRTSEPDCAGVLNVLRAGDRPVALHFGIAGPRGLCWWFPTYDETTGRFSPGIFLVMEAAKAAAEQGLPSIDLGYGQDAWKFSLATASYAVAGGGVWASPVETAMRRLYRAARAVRAPEPPQSRVAR